MLSVSLNNKRKYFERENIMSTDEGGRKAIITNPEGDEVKLPLPYKVYFDSRNYDNSQIIIHARENIQGAPGLFTDFRDNTDVKKPKWVKKLLSQLGIFQVGVGQRTIKVTIENRFFAKDVWKNIEGYLKSEVLDKLK